jgi:hypothetical protein
MVMLFSGIGLPVTGVGLHLQQFEPLTATRHAWTTAHTVLALLFTITAVWHVALNRVMLCNHLKGVTALISREALYALILVVALTGALVSHVFFVR